MWCFMFIKTFVCFFIAGCYNNSMKTGRNEPCPCGSGKKYKHCCMGKIIPFTSDSSDTESRDFENFIESDLFPEDVLDEMDEDGKYYDSPDPDWDDELDFIDDGEHPNPYLKRHILEVIDNQIRDNNPKETRLTFERLMKEGFTEEKAKELIGTVVSTELFELLKNKEYFNESRYIGRLKKLPDLSFLDN